MAGDWIKMEHWTPDKPEVFRVADILGIEPDAVTGKLVRIWIWADQQTTDGNAPSVTESLLDRITSVSGFAKALEVVGWLRREDSGIQFVNFDRHNGETAKKRALTAKRVRKSRKRSCNADVTPAALPREEKRREKKNTESESVDQIYAAYPRRVGKPAALKAIERSLSKIDAAALLALTERYAEAVAGSDPQFIPNPATWFNQERWADDPATWQRSSGTTRQPDLFSGIMAACEGSDAT